MVERHPRLLFSFRFVWNICSRMDWGKKKKSRKLERKTLDSGQSESRREDKEVRQKIRQRRLQTFLRRRKLTERKSHYCRLAAFKLGERERNNNGRYERRCQEGKTQDKVRCTTSKEQTRRLGKRKR